MRGARWPGLEGHAVHRGLGQKSRIFGKGNVPGKHGPSAGREGVEKVGKEDREREENPRERSWGEFFCPLRASRWQLEKGSRMEGKGWRLWDDGEDGEVGSRSQGAEFPGNWCEGRGSQAHLLLPAPMVSEHLRPTAPRISGPGSFSGKANSAQLRELRNSSLSSFWRYP